jgi:hypothetical protein
MVERSCRPSSPLASPGAGPSSDRTTEQDNAKGHPFPNHHPRGRPLGFRTAGRGVRGRDSGVEIGQIAIVSLVVPALLVMDRLLTPSRHAAAEPTRPAFAVYAISAVIIGLGSYWFLARTLVTA